MKLTILIPIYNTAPHHLIEAVMSILDQDDGINHDIILIDDCSTANPTLDALEFAANLTDYIKLIRCPKNSGTSGALNLGHQHVKTEYVAIMGSDDISHPSRFRKQIEYLEANPETDVLGTNLFSFKNDDIYRRSIFTSSHEEKPNVEERSWLVNHGTVIYRQSAVMEVGGYNPDFKRGQDVDLWKRMRSKFIFRNVTEVLYAWRRYNK